MHGTRSSNNEVSFILALVVDKEVAETETSFLAVWNMNLNNGLFCHSCNTWCRSCYVASFSGLSFSLIWLVGFGCIDSSSRNRTLLRLLTLTASVLLLLPSLVRGLSVLGTMRRSRSLSPELRLFNPRVFHRAALALSGSRVGWPDALRTMLVSLASSGARPECYLGLSVDCFLY